MPRSRSGVVGPWAAAPAWLLAPLLLLPTLLSDPTAFTRYQSLRFVTISVAVGVGVVWALWVGWTLPRRLVLAAGACWAATAVAAALSESTTFGFFGAPARMVGVMALAVMLGAGYLGSFVGSRDPDGLIVARTVATLGLCVGLVAIAQRAGLELLGVPEIGSSGRWTAPTGSAAQLGSIAVLLLPVAAGLWIARDTEPADRWLGGCATVLLGVSLVFSGARASWLGAVVAGAVLLWAARSERVRRLRSLAVVGVLAIAGLVIALVDGGLRSRLGGAVNTDGTIRGRWDIWRAATPAVGDRWLVGWGPDQGRVGIVEHLPAGFETRYGDTEIVDRAHSLVLDQLLWTGLLGVAALVALVITWLRFVSASSPGFRTWAVLAGLTGFGVHLLFNFPVPEIDVLAWFLAGVAVAGVGADSPWRPPVRWASLAASALAAALLVVGSVHHSVADHRLDRAGRLEEDGDIERATHAYRSAVDTAGRLPVYREALARHLVRIGDGAAAAAAAQEAADQAPDDPYLTELALRARVQQALLAGDRTGTSELVGEYRTLVDRAPNRVSFRTGLALALLADGKIDEARAVATQASMELPLSGAPESALSLIELIAGNEDAAREHAAEAERRDTGES
ncbi:MAG: O-antigen ligase family protein [Ilumatobacter sp.]|uniref:O-antigen ligase family protein n=1 Tax=Ilumatobacter sp. TaxID=1967498 RepID=UPI00261B466F|nr:O-antigen ligase family protein [Ilumatobacter sp.]MDJ0770867.1 O-antigen ligase family protein [Ilumatobacter sp.]